MVPVQPVEILRFLLQEFGSPEPITSRPGPSVAGVLPGAVLFLARPGDAVCPSLFAAYPALPAVGRYWPSFSGGPLPSSVCLLPPIFVVPVLFPSTPPEPLIPLARLL